MADNDKNDNTIEDVNGTIVRGDPPVEPTDPGTNDPGTGNTGDSSPASNNDDNPKEKISILKSNFAKYLKLTRDGYTLADIIKIYGIDNNKDFGNPLEPKFVYPSTSATGDGGNNDTSSTQECFDWYTDSESGLNGKIGKNSDFFDECECGNKNNQVIISDEASDDHTVINCESEITDGVTFFDFMNVKSEKFFGEPEANDNAETDKEKAIEELKKNYFNGNNDEWKLNPEDAKELENGGHQFYFNKAESEEGAGDGEINIPRTLEQYVEQAKIIPDTEEVDSNDYLQFLVSKVQKFLEGPEADYKVSEDEILVDFNSVINKLFIDFFSQLVDTEKEALGTFRYYNKVAQGEINNEDDIAAAKQFVDISKAVKAINEALQADEVNVKELQKNINTLEEGIWYFLCNFVQVKADAMRYIIENSEFDTEKTTADTVRKMILAYARADGLSDEEDADLSFNRFLKIGFGKFLTEKFGGSEEDLIDFIANYQYKDAMLRKLAMNTIAETDPGQDFSENTPEHYQIAGFDKVPVSDYEVVENGLWTPEHKISNIDEKDNIPTESKTVEDLAPNWIDPTNEKTDEGFTKEEPNPEWIPFDGDKDSLGDVNIEKVDSVKVDIIINKVQDAEEDSGDSGDSGNTDPGSNTDQPVDPGNQGADNQDGNQDGDGESQVNPNLAVESTDFNLEDGSTVNIVNGIINSITPAANDTDTHGAVQSSETSENNNSITVTFEDGTTKVYTLDENGEISTSFSTFNMSGKTINNAEPVNIESIGDATLSDVNIDSTETTISSQSNVFMSDITVSNGNSLNVDGQSVTITGTEEKPTTIDTTVLNVTSSGNVELDGVITSGTMDKETHGNAVISINSKESN